ncbi:LLM class flavin-dependent oxidoreductase [Amycolatopsis regifaucium]|uniref:Luciferase-like domain-containing protein n=1 Tax=Amycolatopsis regifaucium TaxID=546365 RepID=A0A154M7Q4_9PSEU|nr:LLM class flavin-dependent oxidoreductase [Amycolatopsis regifaucium]KZB80367.1 hypothetical protein AVL48_12765 [Amycolatopsis regifaucium]OKA05336.1 hypothetical protein ATP06_0226585 [Amycolatopsis regifaucium]SFJ06317.1 Luciferase-like monooxygenase [Amycolatopsis regifaucium]
MEELLRHAEQADRAGLDVVSLEGEFYSVAGLEPAAAAAPPVWTGAVGPKSLAVTGKLADGWLPGRAADWLSPRFAESRPIIDKAAVEAGRDPAEVATIYHFPGRITENPLAATRGDDGRWIGGSVEQWVEELTSAVRNHAAAGFICFPVNDGTSTGSVLGRSYRQSRIPAGRPCTKPRGELHGSSRSRRICLDAKSTEGVSESFAGLRLW